MSFNIVNRWRPTVIYSSATTQTLSEATLEALKAGADLTGEQKLKPVHIQNDDYVNRIELGKERFAHALTQERLETIAEERDRARRNATWWMLVAWTLALFTFWMRVAQ